MSLAKVLKALVLSLWVGLAPIHPAITAALCLPVVDLILACAADKKKGKPILSAGIKRTVAKVFMYEMAIILAFVTEQYLLSALVPAVRMVTGLIGITELKSCLEHLDDMSGQPFFAALLSRLAPPQPSSPSAPEQNDQDVQS